MSYSQSDQLYTIVSQHAGSGTTSYYLRLNAAHPIYKAHFPGQPITPGACLVQMAITLSRLTLGQEMKVERISGCKFLKPVSPVSTPDITCRLCHAAQPDGSVKVSAEVLSDAGGTMARLSFYLHE